MPKILIDTNLYIGFLRSGRFEDRLRALYTFRRGEIHFSSVVIEELLQGALDAEGEKNVEILYKPFEKANRILTPIHQDWVEAGKILSQIRRKRKELRSKTASLLNDTLIAMSARRAGAVVYTNNQKDFEMIAQRRSFLFEVV